MSNSRSGFTLIEMLVVIIIVGMTIPLLMTIFVSVLRQQGRVKGLEIAKSQADTAFSSIKLAIRNNATSIHSAYPATDANEICNTTTSSPVAASPMVFKDSEGNSFYYSLSGTVIQSQISSDSGPKDMTAAPAEMSNLTFSCERTSDTANPIVTVSFESTHPQIGFTLPYTTKIKLRNR